MNKTIERGHKFENRLNLVVKKKKYYYISHEKDNYPIKIKRTDELDLAFQNANWEVFEFAEMVYFHAL